jgi:hypothetical protein
LTRPTRRIVGRASRKMGIRVRPVLFMEIHMKMPMPSTTPITTARTSMT